MRMGHASGSERKPLIAILVLACLLLLPLISAAPLSRSLSLRNRQPSGPRLEVPAQGTFGADQEPSHGEVAVAARMDIEVNDYPGSGANNRHEPRSPGRA